MKIDGNRAAAVREKQSRVKPHRPYVSLRLPRKMSSTISSTEMAQLKPKSIDRLKTEEKRVKLVRTSSIEKIKRFNSYICSQHYFIVPALLTWLKSSHSGLQNSAEKTIYFFRSLIFNAFFYRLLQVTFKTAVSVYQTKPRDVCQKFLTNFYDLFTKSFDSVYLLYLAVYVATFVVVLQLILCVYLLAAVYVPMGLYFLIITACHITYIFQLISFRRCDKKIK